MGDDFVGVAPDGSGKKVDTTQETTTAGVVERQRVSLAGVGGNNTLAVDATGKVGVNNFPATQPVSAASLPLPTGASTAVKQPALGVAGTASADVISVQGVASMTPVKVDGSAVTQPVSAPALTKGTQGANGFSTQDLKDSGRANIMWTAEFSPAAVAEALLSLTESRDGAATTTFTSKVVTTGKRLRITSINIIVENTLGVNPKRAKLRMRFNTAGAVTTASPLQATIAASVSTAVNTIGQPAFDDYPDGIEFLGDGTKQIGFTLEFPDWVTTAQTGKVYVTIFGYEY